MSPSASEYYAALSRDLAEPITTKFALPDGFRIVSWRPSLLRHVPGAGLSRWKFGLLSALFALLPGGSRYRVHVIFAPDGSVAHHSILHPKYFRFPFMGQHDMQIGGLWTEPRFRGMGLASFTVEAILRAEARRAVTYWYIVKPDNLSSLRVARKNGLVEHGFVVKQRRFGNLLAQFVETDQEW